MRRIVTSGSAVVVALVIMAVALHHVADFDLAGYREALADPSFRDAVAHFPELPSAGLRPLALSHEPQMLQGGGHLQLLCAATEPKAVWAAFSALFAYSSAGVHAPFLADRKDPMKSLPLTTLMVPGHEEELGADWRIGVLSAERAFDFAIQPWNHGKTRGIAINEERHLVLYWCERW